ncbi:MAG: hypothetical protein ABEK59_04810 [Halobacteria archaeon]
MNYKFFLIVVLSTVLTVSYLGTEVPEADAMGGRSNIGGFDNNSTPVTGGGLNWTPNSSARVFYSDDPDPRARTGAKNDTLHLPEPFLEDELNFSHELRPDDENQTVENTTGRRNYTINGLAKEFDVYFYNGSPKVEGLGSDYRQYRRGMVLEPTSRYLSRWPSSAEVKGSSKYSTSLPRTDEEAEAYLEDYYSEFRGFENGIMDPYQSSCDSGLNIEDDCREYVIPENGTVYMASDYRALKPNEFGNTAPTYYMDRKDRSCGYRGNAWCEWWHFYVDYELQEHGVLHTLKIGDQEFTAEDENWINYSNLTEGSYGGGEIVTEFWLNVSVDISGEHCEWRPNGSECNDIEVDKKIEAKDMLTNEVGELKVPANQVLNVSQTVYGNKKIELEFNATRSSAGNKHWSRILFEGDDSYAVNTWGYYMRNRTQAWGGNASRNLNRSVDFPYNYPGIPFTVRGFRSRNVTLIPDREEVSSTGYRNVTDPGVVNSSLAWRYGVVENGENVNLSNGRPHIYDGLVIQNPPGTVSTVEDVFGNEILVKTTRYSVENTSLDINSIGDGSELRIRLENGSGSPVSGMVLKTMGTEKNRYVTGSDGTVIAERRSSFVKVVFERTIDHLNRTVYKQSSDAAKINRDMLDVLDEIWGIIFSTPTVGFFLVVVGVFKFLRT